MCIKDTWKEKQWEKRQGQQSTGKQRWGCKKKAQGGKTKMTPTSAPAIRSLLLLLLLLPAHALHVEPGQHAVGLLIALPVQAMPVCAVVLRCCCRRCWLIQCMHLSCSQLLSCSPGGGALVQLVCFIQHVKRPQWLLVLLGGLCQLLLLLLWIQVLAHKVFSDIGALCRCRTYTCRVQPLDTAAQLLNHNLAGRDGQAGWVRSDQHATLATCQAGQGPLVGVALQRLCASPGCRRPLPPAAAWPWLLRAVS